MRFSKVLFMMLVLVSGMILAQAQKDNPSIPDPTYQPEFGANFLKLKHRGVAISFYYTLRNASDQSKLTQDEAEKLKTAVLGLVEEIKKRIDAVCNSPGSQIQRSVCDNVSDEKYNTIAKSLEEASNKNNKWKAISFRSLKLTRPVMR